MTRMRVKVTIERSIEFEMDTTGMTPEDLYGAAVEASRDYDWGAWDEAEGDPLVENLAPLGD